MKKIIIIALAYIVLTVGIVTITHRGGEKLYLLNWGEYMDPELIENFEEEYEVSVILEEADSSESMYEKISAGTTPYDIAIPGDYIIEKLYSRKLLKDIDFSLLTNYSDDMFNDDLQGLRDGFFEGNEKVALPYFWGTYSIIYSTREQFVEDTVKANGFNCFFDRSLFPRKVKIGMYDTARWAVTAYELCHKIDGEYIDVNNTDFSTNNLGKAITKAVKDTSYDLWGGDLLKKQIAVGNLDICFTQLGDFFDQYYVTSGSGEEVKFGCYIPDNTAAFYDGLVIPKTSKKTELAHKFIDFFLDSQNAYQNACYVGYAPTLKSVITQIEEDPEFDEMLEQYPFYTNPLLGGKKAVLFRDLGVDYSEEVEEIIRSAKN